MNFKKRRINSNISKIRQSFLKHQSTTAKETHPTTEVPEAVEKTIPNYQTLHKNLKYFTFFAGFLVILGLFWITISLVKSLDFGSLIFSFGKQLKTDSHGHTNFVLTGIGGGEHDGGNLTDTIMLVSLDQTNNNVKMLSIPRDLYIEDKATGGQRMNKIYDTYLNKYKSSAKGMEKLAESVTNVTGVSIQYTVKVDFAGFVKIIDAMGGITVNVENAIHDPFFPMGESIKYQTFDIKAGVQNLDGETALKFARSRKTTSDFDRAKRQQQVMTAIKEKAFDLNILTDPSKLQNLYGSLSDSIQTTLTVSEIIELAKIAKSINRENMESRVFSDDFTSCGGLLYTPDRSQFGGAAILLPAGKDFEETKTFANNYLYSNQIGHSPIQILNGTKTSGLALNYLNRLSRDCLDTIYYGNATNRDQENSVIYYTKDQNGQIPDALKQIKLIINAPNVEGIPPEYLETPKRAPAQIIIELGADYKSVTTTDPFNKLLYLAPIEPKVPEVTGAESISIRTETTDATSTISIPKTSTGSTTTITSKPTPTTPAKTNSTTSTTPAKPTTTKKTTP